MIDDFLQNQLFFFHDIPLDIDHCELVERLGKNCAINGMTIFGHITVNTRD